MSRLALSRKEVRLYLTQVFKDVATGILSLRLEDDGVDNSGAEQCLQEMLSAVHDLQSKTNRDIRLHDCVTCQECFEMFNYEGRPERFCSDFCEHKYDEEMAGREEAAGLDREDDCS